MPHAHSNTGLTEGKPGPDGRTIVTPRVRRGSKANGSCSRPPTKIKKVEQKKIICLFVETNLTPPMAAMRHLLSEGVPTACTTIEEVRHWRSEYPRACLPPLLKRPAGASMARGRASPNWSRARRGCWPGAPPRTARGPDLRGGSIGAC